MRTRSQNALSLIEQLKRATQTKPKAPKLTFKHIFSFNTEPVPPSEVSYILQSILDTITNKEMPITAVAAESYLDALACPVKCNETDEYNGHTLLRILGQYDQYETILVLNILQSLCKKGARAESILACLNQTTRTDLTFGMLMVASKNQEERYKYIALLNTLLDKNVSGKVLLQHLNMQNTSGENIGTLFAYSKDESEQKLYFDLLKKLSKNGVCNAELMEHLNNQRLLPKAATNTSNVHEYVRPILGPLINFLCYIYDNADNANKKAIRSSIQRNLRYCNGTGFGMSVLRSMAYWNTVCAEQIYHLVKRDLLPTIDEHTYFCVGEYKEGALLHIKQMRDPKEKLDTLRRAAGLCGENDPLYKLMSYQRGFRKPSVNHGTLKEVHTELKLMGGEAKPVEAQHTEKTIKQKRIISWQQKYPGFEEMRRGLSSSREKLLQRLEEKDMNGIALKDYLYTAAKEYPFILYIMFCKNLVSEKDFSKLEGMQAKLHVLFSHEAIPQNNKAEFLMHATSVGENQHPLSLFMNQKKLQVQPVDDLLPSAPAVQPPVKVTNSTLQCTSTLFSRVASGVDQEKSIATKAHTGALSESDFPSVPEHDFVSQYDDLPAYEMAHERKALLN